MASYKLIAYIEESQVALMNASGKKIVLVKESEGSQADLVWVSFSPFPNNTVSWQEEYGLYASCSTVEGKAKIEKSSYTQATEKQAYPFADGVFGKPETVAIADNTYEVKNLMNEMPTLTFGLAQNVVANGVSYVGNPINAAQLMYNYTATFTPHERVRVFVQENADDGTVITRVTSQELLVDFTTQSEITIKYDPTVGGFVQD